MSKVNTTGCTLQSTAERSGLFNCEQYRGSLQSWFDTWRRHLDGSFTISQVGKGFNRGAWNALEKYTRALARQHRCVYVCTGPLYLPRKEADGKHYVKYEVIGANHVAVPTHFFKVLVVEDAEGRYEMKSFVMPNAPLPETCRLKDYQYPVEAIERAAGFLLFEKIPRNTLRAINGAKPR